MKRYVIIALPLLIAMIFVRAADDDADQYHTWNQAIAGIPNYEATRSLDLSNKQIEAIPANPNLPQLHTLSLDNNQIRVIPANLNLPQLRRLSLNDNQIEVIPANFDFLLVLERLDLNNNQIRAMPADLSPYFPHMLRELNLDNNQIEGIPVNLRLHFLEKLSLKNNQIRSVNAEQILEQFPGLYLIDLSNNPLTRANMQEFRDAAHKARRYIRITDDNIHGDAYAAKKPAKKDY